jgi:hypothetical protein
MITRGSAGFPEETISATIRLLTHNRAWIDP